MWQRIIAHMGSAVSFYGWLLQFGSRALGWLYGWWLMVFIGAQVLVLVLSPSSWRRPSKQAVLHQMWEAASPGLTGFTLLMALFNVVMIHIVVVTTLAYGLTQFALDAVVRVLVLELIPLAAALYVAVSYSSASSSQLYRLKQDGQLKMMRAMGLNPLTQEVLPRMLAGFFAVLLLVALSCVISLVLTYLGVHGFNMAGLTPYHRAVGHIFNPVVSLIFVAKTLLFAMVVSLLPVVNALSERAHGSTRTTVELRALVRMFVLMLIIEIAALVGNYY